MRRRVVLHIGTHRTGTTSIQQALADQREGLLARAGYRFPEGMVLPNNHVELLFASMRTNRLDELARFFDWALMRLENPIRQCQDPIWVERVQAAIARSPSDRLVYSCEVLSLLRHPDEIDRVVQLFGGSDLSVILFVREPAEFLTSYQWSMQVLGFALSDNPDSVMYIRPDSWLVDYEAKADLWQRALGPDRVHVVKYEACMRAAGSTVPAFFEAMGIDRTEANGLGEYFLNSRPTA